MYEKEIDQYSRINTSQNLPVESGVLFLFHKNTLKEENALKISFSHYKSHSSILLHSFFYFLFLILKWLLIMRMAMPKSNVAIAINKIVVKFQIVFSMLLIAKNINKDPIKIYRMALFKCLTPNNKLQFLNVILYFF